MNAPKRGRGRPTLEATEDLFLTVRIGEQRRLRYATAAAIRGESVSAWVKGTLDRAAQKAIHKQQEKASK